jgi:hypothetical protein
VTLIAAITASQPLALATSLTWSQWSTINCSFAGLVAAAVLLLRRSRRHLDLFNHVGSAIRGMRSASGCPRHENWRLSSRFTLSGLFSIITVTGIGVAIVQRLSVPHEHAGTVVGYVFGLLVVATSTFWALMSRSSEALRWLIMLTTCLTIGWCLSRLIPTHDVRFHSTVLLIEALVISAGINIVVISKGCVGAA